MRWASLLLVGCSFEPGLGDEPDAPAAVIDTFSVDACPADYSIIGPTSRYRLINQNTKAWLHSDDCNDDLPGATHLVAIDDPAERGLIESAINGVDGLQNNRVWVGGVQAPSLATVSTGWLLVSGEPLAIALWGGGEPNDGGAIEDNGENFAGLERNRVGLVDFPTLDDQTAICECDGKPLAEAAKAAIDANRR